MWLNILCFLSNISQDSSFRWIISLADYLKEDILYLPKFELSDVCQECTTIKFNTKWAKITSWLWPIWSWLNLKKVNAFNKMNFFISNKFVIMKSFSGKWSGGWDQNSFFHEVEFMRSNFLSFFMRSKLPNNAF